MKRQFNVTDLIASEAERLVVAFRQKLVPHAGEFGAAREQIVRDFLQQQLPKRFGVSSGFIFDCHGDISRQVDVIIYDAYECPVFVAEGGARFFPCEGVISAGEIKSKISSESEYAAALENLKSVRSLDRSASGSNFSLSNGGSIDPQKNHLHQVFTFLFVIDRCLEEASLRRALFEYLWNNDRWLWPNITYAFDKYFTTLGCEGGICPNPMDAFSISVVKNVPNAELLLWFCRLLTQAVASIHTASFSYDRYLHGRRPRPWTSFAFEHAPVKNPLPAHLVERSIPGWWQPGAFVPDGSWDNE